MNYILHGPPAEGVPGPRVLEKLDTINTVADQLGVQRWKLNRAASQGLFPTYRLLNSRRLVKLSEVVAAIEASRQGVAE